MSSRTLAIPSKVALSVAPRVYLNSRLGAWVLSIVLKYLDISRRRRTELVWADHQRNGPFFASSPRYQVEGEFGSSGVEIVSQPEAICPLQAP
jgi:hypothetical protein